jgi:hypothetical protein
VNYPEPPPKYRPRPYEALLLRLFTGVIAVGLLFLAFTELWIGGDKSPSSSDGYPPPDGDVQHYLAYAGVIASLIAVGCAVGYTATGKGAKSLLVSLALAAALGGAWMLFLRSCCGGLTV